LVIFAINRESFYQGGNVGADLQPNEFLVGEIRSGQIGLVEVGFEDVAVYNVDGTFYATQDACPHAEGPLHMGELHGKEVICPWHASCFDVTTGEVTCKPATDSLKTYRVIIDGDVGRVEE
jgi:nitrite reductase/ring-hydroxylating ferredoxin subunit